MEHGANETVILTGTTFASRCHIDAGVPAATKPEPGGAACWRRPNFAFTGPQSGLTRSDWVGLTCVRRLLGFGVATACRQVVRAARLGLAPRSRCPGVSRPIWFERGRLGLTGRVVGTSRPHPGAGLSDEPEQKPKPPPKRRFMSKNRRLAAHPGGTHAICY